MKKILKDIVFIIGCWQLGKWIGYFIFYFILYNL